MHTDVIVSDDYTPESHYHLVKTDRNGTRVYVSHVCPKCGGYGAIDCYQHVEGGTCFMCGGTGEYTHELRVRTVAYDRKLTAKKLQKLFTKYHVAANGNAFVVVGDTYSIREKLREEGAHYLKPLGWYFDHAPENYTYVEIPCDAIFDECLGCLYHPDLIAFYVREMAENMLNANATGETFGKIGERYDLDLTLTHTCGYDTAFGWKNVYSFVDANGVVFVWKTSVSLDDERKNYHMKATVKEHKAYRGTMQTVLTRCKVL